LRIHIPQDHDRGTDLELKLGEWNSRNVDGVKILHRVHILFTPVRALFHHRIRALKNNLFSRDLAEDLMVDIIHIIIACREYCAISEVLILLRLKDIRIDVLDERINRVL
jgi:hypothetical protein